MKKILIQRLSLILSDLFSMLIAFLIAIFITKLYHDDLWLASIRNFFHPGTSKFLALIVLGIFWYQEQYIKRRAFWEELLLIYKVITFIIIINLGLAFVFAKGSLKVLVIGYWVMLAFLLPILRIITKLTLFKLGLWQRDLYILGNNEIAQNAYGLFANNKLIGYNLIAFINSSASELDVKPNASSINVEQLKKRILLDKNFEVVVALDTKELSLNLKLISYLQHNCLAVLITPDIKGLSLYGAQIEHFFGNEQLILRLNNNLARKSNAIIKRLFDIICSVLGIIVLSPVFLICMLITFLSIRKVFYIHKRVGHHNKPFGCIKFQTMYTNGDAILNKLFQKQPDLREEWEQNFKLKNDPRVTRFGAFLRRSSLDELPQLFNVLLGHMSLVGPRPIIREEISRYNEGFYYYQLVRPGITGLWQVSGRSDTDYENRVRLDEWYVKNWSLWYDIVILIKTIDVVIRRRGAY